MTDQTPPINWRITTQPSTEAEREAAQKMGANGISTFLNIMGWVNVAGGVLCAALLGGEGSAGGAILAFLGCATAAAVLFALADTLTFTRAGALFTIRSRVEAATRNHEQ